MKWFFWKLFFDTLTCQLYNHPRRRRENLDLFLSLFCCFLCFQQVVFAPEERCVETSEDNVLRRTRCGGSSQRLLLSMREALLCLLCWCPAYDLRSMFPRVEPSLWRSSLLRSDLRSPFWWVFSLQIFLLPFARALMALNRTDLPSTRKVASVSDGQLHCSLLHSNPQQNSVEICVVFAPPHSGSRTAQIRHSSTNILSR